MKSKFDIGAEIRNLLINNSGITSYINDNIFPIIAPAGTTGNFITYYREKYGREYTQFGPYLDDCKFAVVAVSENYGTSIDMIELISDTIEGDQLTDDNYKYSCYLIDSSEDLIDKKYVQIALFDIK